MVAYSRAHLQLSFLFRATNTTSTVTIETALVACGNALLCACEVYSSCPYMCVCFKEEGANEGDIHTQIERGRGGRRKSKE